MDTIKLNNGIEIPIYAMAFIWQNRMRSEHGIRNQLQNHFLKN